VFANCKDWHHPTVININKKKTKVLRDAKKNFELKLVKNIKNDSKSFFAYARSKSKSKFVPCQITDTSTGSLIDSTPVIAEEFNKYLHQCLM